MINPGSRKQKGVALMIVLATLLVVVALANVVLSLMLSHARLTTHQVERIKAYYANQAAMNLAFEKLRTGDWSTGSYTLCDSGCSVNDSSMPYQVNITISAPQDGIRTVSLSTDYAYYSP